MYWLCKIPMTKVLMTDRGYLRLNVSGQSGGDAGGNVPSGLHPAPSRKQHSALKAKALEGEGPFSNHCRSFDTQMKVLNSIVETNESSTFEV